MTIKDIARKAGYSVGTVSRVLNGSENVSEEAKQKVIEEDDNEVQVACQICQERRPLGILFLGTNREYFKESFHRITVPCVMVTNSAEGLEMDNLSWITTDDKAAAKVAVEHLFSLGHKHIGVLGGNIDKSYTFLCRFEGAKEAFAEYDTAFDEKRQYVQAYFSISEGYFAMEKLLEKMPEVTAVFAMADVMAIGAIRAICDRGMRVPEDVSVIGFDGIDIGRYMMPRLTTIRQHREAIASRSVEVLLGCIEGQMKKVHEIEAFHLVPGESVRVK